MRVPKWIINPVHGRVEARESVMGRVPRYEDINWSHWSGKSMSAAEFERLPHSLARTQEILADGFK
jgi:GTP-dependent phosphoenolpyruvate carboxykinase